MKCRTCVFVAAVLFALPLQAEPPIGPAPKLAVAFVDKSGNIVIEDVVAELVVQPVTRTVNENGVTRNVTTNGSVQTFKSQQSALVAKKQTPYAMDVRQIQPGRLAC